MLSYFNSCVCLLEVFIIRENFIGTHFFKKFLQRNSLDHRLLKLLLAKLFEFKHVFDGLFSLEEGKTQNGVTSYRLSLDRMSVLPCHVIDQTNCAARSAQKRKIASNLKVNKHYIQATRYKCDARLSRGQDTAITS
jgi:hypothetical protein